jgi:hypothetical protein
VYGGEWQLSVLPQVTVPGLMFLSIFYFLFPAADQRMYLVDSANIQPIKTSLQVISDLSVSSVSISDNALAIPEIHLHCAL